MMGYEAKGHNPAQSDEAAAEAQETDAKTEAKAE
jgi:hypothetical protein